MTRRRLLALVFLVLLIGSIAFLWSPLDRRTTTILSGATKVEVFRVAGKEPPTEASSGELRIGGFRVLSQGKDQGRVFADRLAAVLSQWKTYSFTYAKCYWPGVAFRVWKGEEIVDILICFKCDNLYCGPPTMSARVTASFSESPNRARLVALAKEAFPDDQEIQGLTECRIVTPALDGGRALLPSNRRRTGMGSASPILSSPKPDRDAVSRCMLLSSGGGTRWWSLAARQLLLSG
jgi:hypothetical protein